MSRQTRHHWWSASNRRHHTSRKRCGGNVQRRSLRFEPLEDRRLLAVVTVDTLDDSVNLGDGHTSLREAIFATNIVPGADTINFAPALTAGGPATILLTQGELAITDALSINGPGAKLLTIDASGNDPTPDMNNGDGTRIFNLDDGNDPQEFSASISGLTLTGGDISGYGGAVRCAESLTITDTTIVDNSAYAGGGIWCRVHWTISGSLIRHNNATIGGGIFGTATLLAPGGLPAIVRSEISGNTAVEGGGVYFGGFGTIAHSTISGNFASYRGGGVSVNVGHLTLSQVTLSGNQANGPGGGIFDLFADLNVNNSTITLNTADADNNASGNGGGIGKEFAHSINLDHTIVAGNVRGLSTPDDLSTDVSARYSIIGDGSGVTIIDNGGNLIGADDATIDPRLGPLADNGGPTLTHALMPGSPALDAGDPNIFNGPQTVLYFDQRGTPFTRIYDVDGGGPRIDIGAYEAQPFTLVVDTLADESDGDYSAGDLSLREAIELSNSRAGHDTIEFAPALTSGGPAAIVLTLGELAITDAVTIDGPGADLLTIDASGNDTTPDVQNGHGTRIFDIDDHLNGHGIDVAISGLTLTGGESNSQGGAILSREKLLASHLVIAGNWATTGGAIAIFVDGATSTVSDSTITNNISSGDAGAFLIQSGGAVGTVLFSSDMISGNSARNGGAIFAGQAPTNNAIIISGCTITSNSASQQGGAIDLNSSAAPKTIISHSTISGNMSVLQGGALAISGARDLSIEDCEISNNHSTSSSTTVSRGGGVYSSAGDIAISSSTISGNTAAAGGGIYSRNGDLAINFTAIRDNTASNGSGGGILSYRDRLTMTGSTISGNAANGPSPNGRGGGLSLAPTASGPSTILDTVIANNSSSQYGGGLYVRPDLRDNSNTPLVLTNVTISGNSSGRGGGIATLIGTAALGGALVTNGGSISGNTSVKEGGGIYSRSASLTVNGTTISGNHAGSSGGGIATPQSGVQTLQMSFVGAAITGNSAGPAGDGGGLWIPTGTSTITLISTNVSGNSATRGGGIFRGQSIVGGSLTAIDSTISGNMAIQSGGGVYDQGGMLTFTRSSISGNTATLGTSAGGGGIFARQADVSLVDSSLIGNSATNGRGGGAYISNGDFSATGTTIAANSARQDGGGLFTQVSFTDRITFQSSTVSGNSSLLGTGGLVLRGPATIRNSTVTGNAAGGSGAGGIFTVIGPFELDHTLVAKNTQLGNTSPDLRISDIQIVTVRFSLIGDNTGTSLTEAPLGSPDVNGNLIGKPTTSGGSGIIDAKLGALTNNGGPTLTHALLPGSPAIDAGAIISGPPLGYDQRGVPFSRAVDGNADAVVRIDIGAYESQGVPSFAPGDYNQNGVVDAADYTKWRDTLHREVTPFSGADGNGNGRVDQADYELWKSHFGQVLVITPPAAGGGASSSAVASALTATSANTVRPTIVADFDLRVAARGGQATVWSAASLPAAPATVDRALLAWIMAHSDSGQTPASAQSQPIIDCPAADDTSTAEAAVDAVFDRLGDDLIAA